MNLMKMNGLMQRGDGDERRDIPSPQWGNQVVNYCCLRWKLH